MLEILHDDSTCLEKLLKFIVVSAWLIFSVSNNRVLAQEIDASQVSPPRLGLMLASPLKPLQLDLENKIKKVDSPKLIDLSMMLPNWTVLYAQLHPSVLRLLVINRQSDQKIKVIGSGSAVAVDSKTLLSNCHILIDPTHQLVARDAKGKTYPLKLHAQHRATDRCVFKAQAAVFSPVSAIRSLNSLKVGEPVMAIGHPRGIEGVLTEGLIAAIRSKGERKILLTSASFDKGSSGGGLFDQAGNLVGITTGIMNEPQYLGVVIPADDYVH